MALLWIKARIECDRCGKPFEVAIDAAWTFKEGDSAFEMAEEAVRGSILGSDGFTSMVDNEMLCHDCTTEEDKKDAN